MVLEVEEGERERLRGYGVIWAGFEGWAHFGVVGSEAEWMRERGAEGREGKEWVL